MGEAHTDQTQQPGFQMPDRQWEYLLARLEQEETVLFIGPGILPFPGHDSLEDALCQYLQERSEEEHSPFIQKFYRDDKFFMLNEQNKDESLWNFMSYYRDFFKENDEKLEAARAVLRKLVAIPFSTIISLSPNTLIEEAFGGDFTFHADFYNKKKKPQAYVPGRREDPLVYYMRGKMSVDESMVISHSDLFDYLESIYESKSMQPEFKTALKSAKYYVFLGLPLESWYMQLILRLFDFHVVNPRILALKRFGEQAQNQKVVYEDLYKVKFYDSESREFIDQLHQRCADQDLLRKSQDGGGAAANFERDAQNFLSQLKAGHHEQSLASLEELSVKYLEPAKNTNYFNDLMLGASNYRAAHRNYNINLITYDKFQVEEAKLTAFLNMQFQALKALVDGQ
ncbi:MAG: hypothetical protein AAFN81_21595 [Bacteroidota bacterium]